MTKREKELEDLFQRWMKKQGEEKGWEKTTVGGREILRIHFTKDGMVDPEAYEVSSCKILVVLKEANIADNKTEEWLKEHMIDDQRYWYREFVNGKRVFGQMKMGVEKNLTTYRKKNQLEEWHTCYRSTQKIKK